MDVSQLVQQRLSEFGLEQRDLADAAELQSPYISQLLNRKKIPACSGSDREFLDSDVFNITPGKLRRFSGTCETLFISVVSSRQTFREV